MFTEKVFIDLDEMFTIWNNEIDCHENKLHQEQEDHADHCEGSTQSVRFLKILTYNIIIIIIILNTTIVLGFFFIIRFNLL